MCNVILVVTLVYAMLYCMASDAICTTPFHQLMSHGLTHTDTTQSQYKRLVQLGGVLWLVKSAEMICLSELWYTRTSITVLLVFVILLYVVGL